MAVVRLSGSLMTNKFGSLAKLTIVAIAFGFAACTGITSQTDDGPADIPVVIPDYGQEVDVIVDPDVNPGDPGATDADRDQGGEVTDQGGLTDNGDVPDDGSSVDVGPGDAVEVTDNVGTDLNETIDDPGVEPDGCVPQCGVMGTETERECGPDQCGDDNGCGFCSTGYVCDRVAGKCILMCIPNCLELGKVCGDDGCNGNCGECGDGFECGLDFKCYPSECKSDCIEKGMECGVDKCGDSCGTCGGSEVCSAGGKCAPGACFGIDKDRNSCSPDSRYLFICQVSGQPPTQTESLLKIDCYAITGEQCGTRGCDCHYNAFSGHNECLEMPPCVPACDGKECGDDGCGGLCVTGQTDIYGFCKGGWRCGTDDKCRPFEGAECLWVDWMGTCWADNWLYQCSGDVPGQGSIIAENCTTSGKVCYFNVSAQQYKCGTL